MDRNLIAYKLGIDNLEDYIIEEFLMGKKEAETKIEEVSNAILKDIEMTDSNDIKTVIILSDLIASKNVCCLASNAFLNQMILGANVKVVNTLIFSISVEKDKLINLATYILEYFEFNNTSNFRAQSLLKTIRKESEMYNFLFYYLKKTKIYFDILNDICKLENYTWSWTNFEEGLKKVLVSHESEKISLRSNHKSEIEFLELNKKFEIEDLNSNIKDLNRELNSKKREIELRDDFLEKYYDESRVKLSNTYFGDNLPFLLNLFNFLKQNSMFAFSWSYFYNCMTLKNDELIPLTTSKKLNFVGRIFYHLSDYLILQHKDQPIKFLKSKFLINNESISDSFKINHMKVKYDPKDDPELVVVDDFFAKQKRIYHKM